MNRNKQRSRLSEQEALRQSGGYLTFNSGAGKHEKGDLVIPHGKLRVLVEDKVTSKTSYALSQLVWEKALQEAQQGGYEAAVRVTVSGSSPAVVVLYEIWREIGGEHMDIESAGSRALKIEREGSLRWIREGARKIWGSTLVIADWMRFLGLLRG